MSVCLTVKGAVGSAPSTARSEEEAEQCYTEEIHLQITGRWRGPLVREGKGLSVFELA